MTQRLARLFHGFHRVGAAALVGVLLLANSVSVAEAGTNLTVTCANQGPCVVSPIDTPLFDETNIMPGENFSQTMTVINNDADDTCDLGLTVTDQTTGQVVNLADRMFAAIHDGSTTYLGNYSGGAAQAGATYQDLYDAIAPYDLGDLTPGASRTYTWLATFDPTAGNEYQNVQTVFDMEITITCDGGASGSHTPSPTPSSPPGGNDDGGGNSGSVQGTSTSNPGPPVCSDTSPSSAPILTITSVGTNTVSLSWTPVSPVTHYALVFTRISDGAQYGSPNIGNVTSFTVQNLSGGDNYTFEVFGVNGCAPGPRSSGAQTGVVPGGFIGGRPTGGGQTLGLTTEPSPSPSPSASPGEGEILGTTDVGSCVDWALYIPWILLIMQAVFIMANEYWFRQDHRWTKHFVTAGVTLASIGIFYWIRECDCYATAGFSILVWLCRWYWVVALVITGLERLFSYAFVEEVEEGVVVAKPSVEKVATKGRPPAAKEGPAKESVLLPEKKESVESKEKSS